MNVVEIASELVIAVGSGEGAQVVEVCADRIEVVEVAKQGLPGPPGSAENIAEIVPSPILSFENALI